MRFSTKNAWARWARRLYPTNGVKLLMADYGISEGQAKGVFMAQISQPTIDDILDAAARKAPLGDYALGLEILAIRTGITLEQHIEHQAKEAANARAEWQERERHLARLRTRLSAADDQPGALDS